MRYIILILSLFFVTACPGGCEAPGEGEKAERGYSEAKPVIDALEKYFSDKKLYPNTLQDLIPNYIQTLPTKAPLEALGYTSTGESYVLSFTYTGPGVNNCEWTSESKEWKCSGYY